VITQVPGTIPRSGPVRGVFEAFLKKKYVLPVAALHPLVASGMAVAYLAMSCCDRNRNIVSHLDSEAEPALILANLESNRAGGPAVAGQVQGSEDSTAPSATW
jgi:hypothetical protein